MPRMIRTIPSNPTTTVMPLSRNSLPTTSGTKSGKRISIFLVKVAAVTAADISAADGGDPFFVLLVNKNNDSTAPSNL